MNAFPAFYLTNSTSTGIVNMIGHTTNVFNGKPSRVKSAYFSIGKVKITKFLIAGGRNRIYKGIYTTKSGSNIDVSIRIPIKNNMDKLIQSEICVFEKIGSHDNIIGYYGWTIINDKFAIVQELAEKDIFSLVVDKINISTDSKFKISISVLHAIKHLHENGFKYADTKLENTLMCKDGKIKICDIDQFGYTYNYAPLEIHEKQKWTSKSDIWTYGIFLWILWKEELPYYGTDITVLLKEKFIFKLDETDKDKVPEHIIDIVNSCLDYDPDNRPTIDSILEKIH